MPATQQTGYSAVQPAGYEAPAPPSGGGFFVDPYAADPYAANPHYAAQGR
jgi:hypothetical protein